MIACIIFATFPISHFSLSLKDGLRFESPKAPKRLFKGIIEKIPPDRDPNQLKVCLVPKYHEAILKRQKEEQPRRNLEFSTTVPEGNYQIILLDTKSKKHFLIDQIMVDDPERSKSFPRFPNVACVRGKVIDVSDTPLEGISVKIQDFYIGITNENGEYCIDDVPVGNYVIQAVSREEKSSQKNIAIDEFEKFVADIIFPQPVKKILFCKEIQRIKHQNKRDEWRIMGDDDEFPPDVGRVNCYTQIIGAHKNTQIKHRWFWRNNWQCDVPLEVESITWRTYSEKIILPGQAGNWRVDITKMDDTILTSGSFVIR